MTSIVNTYSALSFTYQGLTQRAGSIAEASALWERFRDHHHLRSSECPFVILRDAAADAVATISYNGTVRDFITLAVLFDPAEERRQLRDGSIELAASQWRVVA